MQKKILILSGYGLNIRVSGGRLRIKRGSPITGDSNDAYIARGINEIEHIVILGQTGDISLEAIKWITDQKMMVSMLDPNGNLITSIMPESHISGIIKRRQAIANESLNITIAAWLLSEKFKEQRKTLLWLMNTYQKTDWWSTDRQSRVQEAISILIDRADQLLRCLSIDSQRVVEAQAAAAYWHCFEGIPLKWSKPFKVPLNWQNIGNRTSPKTKSPRKAIEPFNAALNYLYTVLETKTRQTCLINNIDPDFGILHVDHGSRTSLVFDLMEPIRPKVDKALFNWTYEKVFNSKDFFETREGICRISPDIVAEIIPLVNSLNTDIKAVIRQFSAYFKNKVMVQKPVFMEMANRKPSNKSRSGVPKSKQDVLGFNDYLSEKGETAKTLKHPIVAERASSENNERQCLECGLVFIPKKPTQNFCCNKHKDKYRGRLRRETRLAEGKCPQCGKPMEVGANGTYKERLTYCQKCRDYWKRSYEKKVNP